MGDTTKQTQEDIEEASDGTPREMESTIPRELSHLEEETTLYISKTDLNEAQIGRTALTRLQSCCLN